MAMQITFDWNQEDLKRLIELSEDGFKKALKLLAADVWGNIRREAPTDHGRLAGSFDLEQIHDFEYRIISGVDYAMFVHEGTGIYGPYGSPIIPQVAKALSFEWRGSTWVLKAVRGQQPDKFVDRAIDLSEANVSDFIEQAFAEMGV